MKRIFSAIAIFLLPMQLFAQTPLKQGVIEYNWDLSWEKPVAKRNKELVALMPGPMNIKLKVTFKDEQFVIASGFEAQGDETDLDLMGNREVINLKTKMLRTETTIAGITYYTEEASDGKAIVQYQKGTKTIAGYTCNRASVQIDSNIYTVWYTPAIPFAYNPLGLEFATLKGAVLGFQTGGSRCTATSVRAEGFSAADLMPNEKAQKVTSAQLEDLNAEQRKTLSGKYKTFEIK
jgi:GLPGLI family protein